MDLGERTAALAEFDQKRIEKQKAHLGRLDALEARGVDLDVLTEIFGAFVLEPSKESAGLIDRFEAILNALEQPQNYTALLGSRQELAQGCYGFGAPARYDIVPELIIFQGLIELVCTNDDEKSTASISVRATEGIFVRGEDRQIKPIGDQEVAIARSINNEVPNDYENRGILRKTVTFNVYSADTRNALALDSSNDPASFGTFLATSMYRWAEETEQL